MAASYPLPLFWGERVEHGVVRMDGREAILGQLLIDQVHYLLHTTLIVTPVTHNLKQALREGTCKLFQYQPPQNSISTTNSLRQEVEIISGFLFSTSLPRNVV